MTNEEHDKLVKKAMKESWLKAQRTLWDKGNPISEEYRVVRSSHHQRSSYSDVLISKDRIIRDYKNGVSTIEISERTGFSPNVILKLLKNHNVKIRNRREAQNAQI